MNPDHQFFLIFYEWNAGNNIKMVYSLIQSETVDSSRRNVRLNKPKKVIPSKIVFSNSMTKPSISIAINSHLHNFHEDRNVQLTLIQAKLLTHSLNSHVYINSGYLSFFKGQKQGKYTCPGKYQVKYTYPNTVKVSILTLGQVYLP